MKNPQEQFNEYSKWNKGYDRQIDRQLNDNEFDSEGNQVDDMAQSYVQGLSTYAEQADVPLWRLVFSTWTELIYVLIAMGYTARDLEEETRHHARNAERFYK